MHGLADWLIDWPAYVAAYFSRAAPIVARVTVG
jgi:hypothetical protein